MSGSEFKVGDRVRVRNAVVSGFSGRVGTVDRIELTTCSVYLRFTGSTPVYFAAHEVELVTGGPVLALAWRGKNTRPRVFWRHPGGRLTVTKYGGPDSNDLREQGWVEDLHADIPQDPPEPVIEPGWYVARINGRPPYLMHRSADGWRYHGARRAVPSRVAWEPLFRLDPEQAAAVEKAEKEES